MSLNRIARTAFMLVFGAASLHEVRGNPAKDFEALEEQLEAAYSAYAEARAKAEGNGRSPEAFSGREKVECVAILRRMDAVVDSAGGTPDAAEPAVRTFLWTARTELDLEWFLPRFERMVNQHSENEAVIEALEALPDKYSLASEPKAWTEATRRLAERTKNKAVQSAALTAEGLVLLKSGDSRRAKPVFERIISLGFNEEQTRTAKGYLFEIERLQIGMTAPDFSARTIDGKEFSLHSLRGKTVLLDFWATWCGPCLVETPHLKAAAERFGDKSFVIVGVSLDDFKEMLEAVIEQKKLPGLQTWDAKGRDNPAGELYNVQDLPQWFLLDSAGVIRARNPFGEALIPAVEKLMTVHNESSNKSP